MLSDRGANFLSDLVQEVHRLLSTHLDITFKVTDWLKNFNSTLSAMLSEVAEAGKDWDHHLPFVLFAYQNSVQDSIK